MVMGEPLDLSEEIQWQPSRKAYLLISQKVRTSIAELGEREREIRAQFES